MKFHAGSDGEITSVTVWNDRLRDGKPVEGSRRWQGEIGVTELEGLARSIAGLYVRKFASVA